MFLKSPLLRIATRFVLSVFFVLLALAGCRDGTTNATGALPEITTHPRDTIVTVGGDASFSVTAVGATSFRWIRNASDTLEGATSPNLTVTDADTTLDGSTYKCLVRNAHGFVVSNTATLQVNVPAQPPVILTQPVSVAVLPGGTAVFSVTATGENLAYQWYRNDFLLEGKNSATLTLPGVSTYHDSTLYRCLVSNAYGQTFSQAALLRFDALRTQLLDTGATVYNLKCLGCHGMKGRGLAGATPPLANADYFLANRNKSIEIALGGVTDSLFVNGQWYTGTSPAFADDLTDVQIAGVLTYLRVVWNDSTVTGCNANALDGNGFATCTKTARSPAAIAADSVSYREVKAVRENLLPL